MQADPQLSFMGQERAKRLITALHEYSLDEIYSTNFIRTKSTALPIAEFRRRNTIV
jgi:broad specificity phosphatase PhoE